MNVKVDTEEKLVHTLREAIHILENMRRFQKLWEEAHGVELKERKKYWEGKADNFLTDLGEQPGIIVKS